MTCTPESEKVLDACRNAEWRLIFALSRIGGLRCLSEHMALRWEDIHWEQERLTVHSSKTERYSGGASRVIPLFKGLRPFLAEVFDRTEEGAEFVIANRRRGGNLRTQLGRIVKRAGLKPWPRIFHNLRASRQTELESQHPTHVACSWIGNSPRSFPTSGRDSTDSPTSSGLTCARGSRSTPESNVAPVSV